VCVCVEPKVSPATFCRVFPFHLLFDRELRIVQTGSTVARVMPRVTRPGCRITDILDTVRYCVALPSVHAT
jgi:guanylate cyclase soluble subunit beta